MEKDDGWITEKNGVSYGCELTSLHCGEGLRGLSSGERLDHGVTAAVIRFLSWKAFPFYFSFLSLCHHGMLTMMTLIDEVKAHPKKQNVEM